MPSKDPRWREAKVGTACTRQARTRFFFPHMSVSCGKVQWKEHHENKWHVRHAGSKTCHIPQNPKQFFLTLPLDESKSSIYPSSGQSQCYFAVLIHHVRRSTTPFLSGRENHGVLVEFLRQSNDYETSAFGVTQRFFEWTTRPIQNRINETRLVWLIVLISNSSRVLFETIFKNLSKILFSSTSSNIPISRNVFRLMRFTEVLAWYAHEEVRGGKNWS